MSKVEKRWVWEEIPDSTIRASLSKSLNNLHPALTALLLQRGIDSFDKAKEFFRPQLDDLHDPFLMQDMETAAERVYLAIQSKEKIIVYGDYDVDGTTSVASMSLFLDSQNANFEPYIPDRYAEGYGVSEIGIRYAADQGTTLLITLDCGIKAHAQIALANSLGIDVIVCDHHTPDAHLPEAVAVLDHKRPDCSYPDKNLCGCGVGFKLIQAVCTKLGLEKDFAFQYLDLLAIAIGADIVPVTGENRILASKGLEKLNADPTPGIAALIHHADYKKSTLTMMDVVFGVAPRINAAGRIEHGRSAVALLMNQDVNDAIEFGKKLNLNNLERRDLDQSITQQATEMVHNTPEFQDKKSTVLFDPEWHKGVIGIVASRVQKDYYRPTIILTRSGDVVAGSARSVQGFNVYDAIDACSEHLIQFGGHMYAAGMTMEEKNIPAFREMFEQVVSATIEDHMLIPEVRIDYELTLDDIDQKFYRVQQQLAPFGPENLEPVYSSSDVLLKYPPRIVGSDHLKLKLFQDGCTNSFDAIGFNLGEYADQLDEGVPFEIAFTVDENTWNGKTTLQLKIKDIRL